MFSFFQTIFTKVTSAVTSVIIAVGLVFAPGQQPEPPQQVRVITEAKEEPRIEIEQASSTLPSSASFPTSVPAKTSKVATPLNKPKSVTSAPVSSSSLISTTSQSNNAVVESNNTPNVQTTTTQSTITTQPSTGVTQQVSTPATIEELQITSSKITPYLTSAEIEWQTNKPTQSRTFIWGNSFNKVYQSESGLSTRHFVNASGLNAGTNYSYELESIAGEQVARKQGSFSTIDKSEIVVMAENNGFSSATNLTVFNITVSVLDRSGKYVLQAPVHWDWPEDDRDYIFYKNKNLSEEIWLAQKKVVEDKLTNANYSYLPTTPGTKTIRFTSGSLSRTITLEPQMTTPISHEVTNIITNSPIEAKIGNQKIGSFELTSSDIPDVINTTIFETNVPDAGNNLLFSCDNINCFLSGSGAPSKTHKIEVYTGASALRYIPVGSYYVTIKSLFSARQIVGLPVTFNFTVASSTSQ